jgi:hypothetical protein
MLVLVLVLVSVLVLAFVLVLVLLLVLVLYGYRVYIVCANSTCEGQPISPCYVVVVIGPVVV